MIKTILGIETSCDETAAAVLQWKNKRIQVLSNIVSSSASLQEKYGGVLPEQAAREQVRVIIPVIEESLQVSGYRLQEIDAIAVTCGPGLIGSLLVGVETAKTLAKVANKPLIPVNHLLGHFYANWIDQPSAISSSQLAIRRQKRTAKSEQPDFPLIGLLVSGGHTDLVYFKNHHDYQYLGGTRDDAAGECFDKCARLLGLPYPGGPQISKLAEKGDPKAFDLPRPMINSKDFDFSFSGLKTALANLVKTTHKEGVARIGVPHRAPAVKLLRARTSDGADERQDPFLADLAASLEQAIVDVLVTKTIQAVQKYQVKQVIVAGGVASNKKLRSQLQETINHNPYTINLSVPPPQLCTDNGAMIAARAFFEKPLKNALELQADPNLSLFP